MVDQKEKNLTLGGARTKVSKVVKNTFIFLTGMGTVLLLMSGWNFHAARTVAELLSQDADSHATEATAELCGSHFCLEGWKSDIGNFLRFEKEGQAEYWQTILGDTSRRNGNILVDFSGKALTIEQKKLAVDLLYSGKDWY
jgi:hypothetical protein